MYADSNLVPKVHPLTRGVELEDPMELVATPVLGDPELMLECLVQEFAWLGWDADRIFALFRDPFYPPLHGLLGHFGEQGVRERIAGVVRRTGAFRFEASVDDEPEPQEQEPELIELGIRNRPAPKEDSHAESP